MYLYLSTLQKYFDFSSTFKYFGLLYHIFFLLQSWVAGVISANCSSTSVPMSQLKSVVYVLSYFNFKNLFDYRGKKNCSLIEMYC